MIYNCVLTLKIDLLKLIFFKKKGAFSCGTIVILSHFLCIHSLLAMKLEVELKVNLELNYLGTSH